MSGGADDARPGTTVRWYARNHGRPVLLVSERVQPWTPAKPDPAEPAKPAEAPTVPPTLWTSELVRARLAEAMRTLKRLPMGPRARPSTVVAAWPDIVRDMAEAYGYGETRSVNRPSPAEIGRLDETLPWLFLIEDSKQRLSVIGVAMGLNLRVIGRTFGCSHETVRQRERAGIDALVHALNAVL